MAAILQSAATNSSVAPKYNIIWQPQDGPQKALIECPVYDVFFGGARGGGKTDGMLGDWVCHAQRYGKAARGLILRREYEQVLKFLLPRMRELFIPLGAVWKGEERYWLFPNGASFYVRHLDLDSDAEKYQGDSYTRIYVEELTNFPSPAPLDKLHGTLRSADGVPVGFRATGNPGGPGHGWVKFRYIDPCPAGMKIFETDVNGVKFKRVTIRSKLSDNKILDLKDPGYRDRLRLVGNEELVRGWLEGDWDIVAGAALNITKDRHLIRSFVPPRHWTRFTSLDWGYVKPYCHGWYCVVEGTTLLEGKNGYADRYLPDGAVVKYRELYGWTGKPDQGSREESPIVAKKIITIEEEAHETIDYRVADTQLWAKNDGPSMCERMYESTKGRFSPRPAEKDRQSNYSEFCARLKGVEMDKDMFEPMFYVTDNCTQFWRTVPPIVLDETHPERGPDECQELHSYDETAYALISRPFKTSAVARADALFHKLRQAHMLENADPYSVRKKK